MNDELKFVLRSYGFGELSQLYFPNIKKKSAASNLKKWIVNTPKLINKLHQADWQEKRRSLMPSHVKIIVEHFGEP